MGADIKRAGSGHYRRLLARIALPWPSYATLLLLLAYAGGVVGDATSEASAQRGASQSRSAVQNRQGVSNARPAPAVVAKTKIHSLINQTAKQHGVEPALVHAVISAESAYNPKAVSRAGAIGLMQVMPETAVDYGIGDASALYDPAVNIKTGVRHLKRLLSKYGNDYGRVIMAYNAGEGVVDRTDSNVTYAETLSYTEAVIRRYRQLGGTKPTEAALRKVALLRGQRGRSGRRVHPPKEIESDMLLPKVSPNLQVGNMLSALGQSPNANASRDVRPASNEAGRAAIRSGLRTGIDPVIRDVARSARPGGPATP
jgi:hypothetical protein